MMNNQQLLQQRKKLVKKNSFVLIVLELNIGIAGLLFFCNGNVGLFTIVFFKRSVIY